MEVFLDKELIEVLGEELAGELQNQERLRKEKSGKEDNGEDLIFASDQEGSEEEVKEDLEQELVIPPKVEFAINSHAFRSSTIRSKLNVKYPASLLINGWEELLQEPVDILWTANENSRNTRIRELKIDKYHCHLITKKLC